MSVVLYLKDKITDTVHEYGTDPNDGLLIDEGTGGMYYFNHRTGGGTLPGGEYVFCDKEGNTLETTEYFL